MQPLAALFNCHARIHTHTHFCKYMHARTPHRHIRSLSIKALNWETVLQALVQTRPRHEGRNSGKSQYPSTIQATPYMLTSEHVHQLRASGSRSVFTTLLDLAMVAPRYQRMAGLLVSMIVSIHLAACGSWLVKVLTNPDHEVHAFLETLSSDPDAPIALNTAQGKSHNILRAFSAFSGSRSVRRLHW